MRSRIFWYPVYGVLLAFLCFAVTSPALLEEPLGKPLTGYGIAVAAAALIGMAAFESELKRERVASTALPFAFFVTLSAFLAARALYCAIRLPYYLFDAGPAHMLRTREGGFLLYGAMLGAAVCTACCARRMGFSFAERMDRLAVPGMLSVAVCRLGEGFAKEGLGNWVENEALWHLPFAIQNSYGEYQWALFLEEAITALAISALLLMKKPGKAGERALSTLLLYACCQIVLESLRVDSVLKIGFVRVSQVLSAAAILLVLVVRRRCDRKAMGVRILLFALLLGCIGGIEWALDKTGIPAAALYAGMIACCALLGRLAGRPKERETV